MKRSTVKDHEAVAYAVPSGKAYIINEETKTARAFDRTIIDFVINNEEEGLDESIEKQNTHILYNFIKASIPDATLKYGKVRVADYTIRYASHGFEIRDDRNYGQIVNVNDWHNDYPTPERVLEFIQSNILRPRAAARPVQKEEIERGQLHKLAALGKVKLEKQGTEIIVSAVEKKPEKDRLHKETEFIYLRYKEKKLKFKDTVAALKKRLPKLIEKQIVASFTKFHKKEISWRKLTIELAKLMKQYQIDNAALKEERQKKLHKQPPFIAPTLYEPINPIIRSTDLYMAANGSVEMLTGDRQHHVIDCKLVDVDVLWMKFQNRGPAGTKYWVTCTVEEYLANVVLHHYPKAMPLLMKVASGEMEVPDVRTLSFTRFVQDAYQKYDPQVLRHPVDRDTFCKLCNAILMHEGMDGTETCFMWVYSNEFKTGEQVKVYSPLYAITNYGEVISTDTGITIRYEGGTVDKLKRGEVIQPFQWRKKK